MALHCYFVLVTNMASGQRGAELPNCIDFSSAHKFWIAWLTGSWFSTSVTAQSLIPPREGKCNPQKLLQIRQRKELSTTSVSGENVPCVFWIQPKNSLRWGVSLKMLSLLLFCQDLRLGYRWFLLWQYMKSQRAGSCSIRYWETLLLPQRACSWGR